MYDRLFERRSRLGRELQPEHSPTLDVFDASLPLGKNPFETTADVRTALARAPGYRTASAGLPAVLGGSKYLYRLSTVAGIVEFCTWNGGRRPVNNKSLHRKLVSKSASGSRWLPLSGFARGELASFRGASFFTPIALRRSSIARDMARTGVPSDWVFEHSVLLRLDLAKLLQAGESPWVPTVVDAYTYQVFRPTRTEDGPKVGTAIDVSSTPLRLGLAEVVVPPVPVNFLKLKPVTVTPEMRLNDSRELLDILPELEHFYSNMEDQLSDANP